MSKIICDGSLADIQIRDCCYWSIYKIYLLWRFNSSRFYVVYTKSTFKKKKTKKKMTCSLINNTNTYNVTCSDVENNRHILSNATFQYKYFSGELCAWNKKYKIHLLVSDTRLEKNTVTFKDKSYCVNNGWTSW